MAAALVTQTAPATIQDGPSAYQEFFGMPKGPITTDPFRYRTTQNWDLPDAFKGKSQYLGEMIDQQILTGDSFYTRVLLPVIRTDQMSISWNRWEFDQHFLDVVPEEGVSRLLENRVEGESRTIVRRGIALQLEHGFMKTERGRMNYIMNLRQIYSAIQETTNFDVLSACLQADNYNITWQKRHGYYNRMRIQQRIELEIEQWACIQKDPFGFEKLNARVDDLLSKTGGKADTWVLPPGLDNWKAFQPHQTDYYLSGKPFSQDSVKSVRLAGSQRVFIMRNFNIERGVEPLDISVRERQIGSFNTMFDRLRNIRKGDEYRSAERIVKRYDVEKDDWVSLTLDMALENAHLFNDKDTDGMLVKPRPMEAMIPHFKDDIKFDPFLMGGGSNGDQWDNDQYQSIGVIGHMTENNFKTRSALEAARCLLREVATKDEQKELEKELVDFQKFTKKQLSVADVAGMIDTKKLLSIDPIRNKDRVQTMILPGERYYALKSDANVPFYFKGNSQLSKAIRGLSRILPGNPFIDGKNASFANISTHTVDLAERTLVENLLGFTGLNVWARKMDGSGDAANINGLAVHKATLDATVKMLKLLVSSASGDLEAIFKEDVPEQKSGDGKVTAPAQLSGYLWGRTDTANWRRFRELLATTLVDLFKIKGGNIEKRIEDLKTMKSSAQTVTTALTGKSIDDAGVVWDALFRGKSSIFEGVTSLNDSSNEIRLANKTDLSIGAGGLEGYVPDAENSFHMTELILSWDSVRSVLDEILATATATNSFPGKFGITFSNPSLLNTPLTTWEDLKRLKNLIETKYDELMPRLDVPSTYPLLQFLSKVQSKPRRSDDMVQKTSNKRARTLIIGNDDDDDEMSPSKDRAGDHVDEAYAADLSSIAKNSVLKTLYHDNLMKRMTKIEEESHDLLEKLFAKIYSSAPANKTVFKSLVNKNIILPLNFITANPHMRYNMQWGFKIQAGGETGNVYMGFGDFIVGDDPRYKMHYGHFTTYMKAIIKNPKNLYIAFDIFCHRYLGGGGTKPIRVDEGYNPNARQFTGDTVFLAVPYEFSEVSNVIDLSGHFKYFEEDANLDSSLDTVPHYPTAARYNSLFKWRTTNDVAKWRIDHLYHSQIYDPARQPINFNTVVCWDAELYYNISSRLFNVKHQNTGHFGPFCYPGCKALRNGVVKPWIEPPSNTGEAY